MKIKLTITTLALASAFVHGTASAQTAETYKLKHRSAYTDPSAHNPFWPIGWTKGDVVQQATAQEAPPPISAESFAVTSISLSAAPLAVINGKTYGEGEIINAISGTQRLHIQVVAITDGSVVLQYLNKRYTIPLRRPQLNSERAPIKQESPAENAMILH